MTPHREAAVVVVLCGLAVLAFVAGLISLHGMSKTSRRPVRGEAWCRRAFATAQRLGDNIMSVLDAALARFTAFVSGVLGQVSAAKEINDAQTAKLVELQEALAAARADDEEDKATIANLQAEVSNLQAAVADQINAAIDALENPPVAEEDEEVVEVVEAEEVEVVAEAEEVVEAEEDEVVVEEESTEVAVVEETVVEDEVKPEV